MKKVTTLHWEGLSINDDAGDARKDAAAIIGHRGFPTGVSSSVELEEGDRERLAGMTRSERIQAISLEVVIGLAETVAFLRAEGLFDLK